MFDRIELSPSPRSVALARRWSTDQLSLAGCAVEVETVALLVSELVSNVVLHARTACELMMTAVDNMVRVEVHDGSDAMPMEGLSPDPLSISGRGLALVAALSTTYGMEALPNGGKLVWFELSAPARPPS